MTHTFEPQARLIVVPTHLYGPAGEWVAHLALDTGASYTIVSPQILAAIGCDPAFARERVQITTGSGVELVPQVLVGRLRALGCARLEFPVLSHSLPPSAGVDGVLGLDFLRNLRL